jgi:hypothetical protein
MKPTRRVAHGPLYPEHWQVSPTYDWTDKLGLTRTLEPGTELRIAGEGGTFRFCEHVLVPPHGRKKLPREWIAVIGGTKGVVMFRFFRPERIASAKAKGRRVAEAVAS